MERITEQELTDMLTGTAGGEFEGTIWEASWIHAHEVPGQIRIGGGSWGGVVIDVTELTRLINERVNGNG